MEFQKLIETRRTIRKYAANSEVTREQMEALIRAAQEAPSWKNSETGRYYCVLSREMVDKIRTSDRKSTRLNSSHPSSSRMPSSA